MQKKLIWGVLIVATVVLLASGQFWAAADNGAEEDDQQRRSKARTERQQQRKPDFTLKDLKDQEITLSDYREEGKVVLVNVWAHWCPPCVAEIPDLVRLRENYKDRDFEILGVVAPSGVNEGKVRKMVKDYKMDYPVVWGTHQSIAQLGVVQYLPTTFVIDKSGNIVETLVGGRDYASFEAAIKKHL